MSNPYGVLAHIYDAIGMSEFARVMTPRLIEYAQQRDWVGRRVIDLGCGTGASTRWLASHGYATTAVDTSAEMLETARRTMPTSGLSLTWEQRDIRTLGETIGQFDMALALDVLNDLNSLRDLEQTFAAVYQTLDAGKIFAFDMTTIQGLSESAAPPDQTVYDDNNLFVMTQNEFDYDRQIAGKRYHIFQRDDNLWHRLEARLTLRGYPVQAVVTLLQRTGYDVMATLTPDLAPYQVGNGSGARVIVIAVKA
jgi:SAM-dependent methyltransferase